MTPAGNSLAKKRPLRIRHYFTHYQSLGGVQSIIDTHLRLDPAKGLSSSMLAFFDPAGVSPANPAVEGLGLSGKNTICGARKKFQRRESGKTCEVPVYHDLWGLPFFGEFDTQSLRRIGAVHSKWPHLKHQLRQLRGSLDGIFTDSQPIADLIQSQYSELRPDRIRHLPVPAKIAPESHLKQRPALAKRRIVIGFVGRLEYAQKRVERFPKLFQKLTEEKINCELQFLGEGSAKDTLPSRFPSDAVVAFLGRKSGEDYWKIMSKWDFILYTSDHEGSPLSMIESMSVGNLPIFPKIGSGGDGIVEALDPALLYPPEDWNRVADIIKTWQAKPAEAYWQARQKSRKISLRHSPEAYHSQFMDFLKSIIELPKISQQFSEKRPCFLSDYLPFGLLCRCCPKSFFRSNPLKQTQRASFSSRPTAAQFQFPLPDE